MKAEAIALAKHAAFLLEADERDPLLFAQGFESGFRPDSVELGTGCRAIRDDWRCTAGTYVPNHGAYDFRMGCDGLLGPAIGQKVWLYQHALSGRDVAGESTERFKQVGDGLVKALGVAVAGVQCNEGYIGHGSE